MTNKNGVIFFLKYLNIIYNMLISYYIIAHIDSEI